MWTRSFEMQGKRIALVFSLLIAATTCVLLAQTAAEQQARSSQQAAENAQRQEVDDARHMADGLNAFENGDFTSAKASFRNVLASRKGEAQGWLNKIAQYEQAMSDGQQAEAQKNY